MHKHDVRTEAQALCYLTDCTLATVQGLAMRKSRPKYEYRRQILIAQQGVDWIRSFKIAIEPHSRWGEVLNSGLTVEAWAQRDEENKVAPPTSRATSREGLPSRGVGPVGNFKGGLK